MDQTELKRQAAELALKEVSDGMVLGLGTGSTAAVFVEALIDRVKREGMTIRAIATSEATDRQARAGGIEITDFTRDPVLDCTFDGADVVDLNNFAMLKGLGGALLREKIVAQSSKRLVIMVDQSKVTERFGGILPVEIVRFGYESTMVRLKRFGDPVLRHDKTKAEVFVTDGGNYIADIACPSIDDPDKLQTDIKTVAGVIETGLFLGMADVVVVGSETGAAVHRRPRA
jgi:ribose 5-phosphate isomerase A